MVKICELPAFKESWFTIPKVQVGGSIARLVSCDLITFPVLSVKGFSGNGRLLARANFAERLINHCLMVLVKAIL